MPWNWLASLGMLASPPRNWFLLTPDPTVQAQLASAIQDCGFNCSSLGSGEAATLLLSVGGMACASCSSAVEAALRSTQGALEASVSLLTSKAEVGVGVGKAAALIWNARPCTCTGQQGVTNAGGLSVQEPGCCRS